MNVRDFKDIVLRRKEKIMYPYNLLIDIMGYEGICALVAEFGGSAIYVPTYRRLFSGCLMHEIIEEYNGTNIKSLCRKYGYCEKTIRDIVSGKVV